MGKKYTIADITHPDYDSHFKDWMKWRLTYEGGQRFINNYLEKFSARENPDMFEKRKNITYNPAFAKQAIDEVKNSIFQRMIDVLRYGGSETYKKAILGLEGGVDLLGSSMSYFIGTEVLPELLSMSRVGIFVDMPQISGVSIADVKNKRPYLYTYKVEDIRCWSLDESNDEIEYTHILLKDYTYTCDEKTGLTTGISCRYRRMWLEEGKVKVQFYNDNGAETTQDGTEAKDSVIELNITKIPFVVARLSDSLLSEVANYQIALLNLASSDLAYALQSNYPFYTEQFSPQADTSRFLKTSGIDSGGQSSDATTGKTEEVRVGIVTGRRYPKGLERPGFIHPSPEPLRASMDKQEQLKYEIRQLINLSVANLDPPKQISAEAKGMDNQGLETGLSYIGLELENLERKITFFWSMYENSESSIINYPESYSLKSESERRKEADEYIKILPSIPSITAQKEIIKIIAQLLLCRKVGTDELDKILHEIEAAPGITSDSKILNEDILGGILDHETASILRGYPKGTVEKANKEHVDRLLRIKEAQTPKEDPNTQNNAARGVKDLDPNLDSGKQEKRESKDTTKDPIPQDKTRGEGK